MIEPEIITIWQWSDLDFCLIKRIQVSLIVRGNLGSQMDVEGPIIIDNFSDFHECWEILKERLYKRLNANLDQ